ncbi:MAG: efflux transporter outer membrane subunit [Candidatus Sumerlaeia bacterium]
MNTRRFASLLCLIASAALMSGCLLGPDFKRPSLKLPTRWVGAEETTPTRSTGPAVELGQWWGAFQDPTLNALIDRAMKSNLDVRLAVERVRQARAALGQAESSFWPTLDFSASYSRTHTRVPKPEVGSDVAGADTKRSSNTNMHRAGFDSVWEADIFGGVRRGVEASRADLLSSELDLRNALVTLTAEVGLDYLDLRALQEQLRITRENLVTQKQSAEITRRRYEVGIASGLDQANAQAVVANTSAQIPSLESQIRQMIYRISYLLGEEPGALIAELDPPKPYPAVPPRLPAEMPATLLDRRPDIRSSEAALHAATARIGVAMADLLPRLTLNAAASANATKLGSWNREVTSAYSFGPSLSWNIFSGGLLWNRVKENRAVADQALTRYQQAVLTALQEVETAWTAYNHEIERGKALSVTVAQNRKALSLATQLYTEGETDFLSVLVSEQALLNSQNALIQSRNNVAGNLVTLYKALGGGWTEGAAQAAQANAPLAFSK